MKNIGHEVMVISLYDGLIENVDTVVLPRTKKLFYIKYLSVIKREIKKFKPDILHAHHGSSYGLLGALVNFHPYIISVWGYDVLVFPKRSFMHKAIVNYALSKTDLITATSKALAKAVKGISNKDAVVVPFGVEELFFHNERHYRNKNITIGIVKDLLPVYGIDVLIESFSLLISKGYDLNLIIVGEGPLEKEYKQNVRKKGLSDKVSFRRKVEHSKVVDVLSQIDIFTLPSHSEGFGVAAVEAMATGLPVIASKVGGLPEVVDDGITGIHVKPGDVDDLTKALITYIESAELRKIHGTNGRAKVEREYRWLDNAEMMNNLYYNIIKHK